jgi:UDP-N-acetylglucosamine acyltransferase
MTIEGSPARVRGVNLVGLKRREKSPEAIKQLRAAYRKLYQDEAPVSLVLDELESVSSLTPEVLRLVSSLRDMERGYQGRYREALRRPPQQEA